MKSSTRLAQTHLPAWMAIFGLAVLASIAPHARAAFTITIQQSGNNVVANGSGSINLTGLSTSTNGSINPQGVNSGQPFIGIGGTALYNQWNATLTGPANFGSSTNQQFNPNSVSGTAVAIFPGFSILDVQGGYTSGTSTTDSAQWNNTTLAGLNLVAGTYTYTIGQNSDTITVLVVAAPEPATLGLIASGLLLTLRRRRHPAR